MKKRLLALLFTCSLLLWGGVAAFVELRNSSDLDRWRIDHATDAGPGSNEEAFQIIDIDGGTDPRLNLYLDNGRLGATQFCDLDGTNCSTPAQIVSAVAGDDLGDHTATTDLVMGANNITGTTGNIDLANFDVIGSNGNTTIGGTLDADGDFAINTDKFTVNSTSGNVLSAGTIQTGADGADGGIVIYSEDVGGDFTYTIQPGVATGNVVLTLPVDDGAPNQVLQTDGSGALSWVNQTSGADDLGDHTATQDLILGTNDLRGTTGDIDYDNFDVVGSSGNTTIGGTLDVTQATGVDGDFDVATDRFVVNSTTGNVISAGTFQTGIDGADGGIIIYSEDVGGDFTYTIQPGVATGNVVLTLPVDDGTPNQVLQTDGGGVLTWVDQAGADDLGDHNATQDLILGTNDLRGTTGDIDYDNFDVVGSSGNTTIGGTLTLGSSGDIDVNTGAFTVTASSGNTAVGGTLDVTGATGIDGDFDVATDKFTVNSTSGNVLSAGTIQTGADGADGGIVIYSEDVGGDFTYTIQPGVATGNVVLTLPVDDGTPNQVLQTDGSGVLTWADQTVADNLGNHTATTDLVMGTNAITGTTGNIDYDNFDVVGASGNTTIGGTLDVTGVTTLATNASITDGTLTVTEDSATTNAVVDVVTINATTSGSIANNFGVGLTFDAEDGTGTSEEQGSIDLVLTDITDTSEDSEFVFSVQEAGAITPEFTIAGDGITLASGVAVNNILDDDTFGDDSATALATQQSIKAYVDTEIGALSTNTLDGAYDEGGAGSGRTITVDTGAVRLSGTDGSDESLEVARELSGNNAVIDVAVIEASTSDVGNGAQGLGAGLVFAVENSAGEVEERASIDVTLDTVTDGVEDSEIIFTVQEGGSPATELTISKTGIELASGVTVNEISNDQNLTDNSQTALVTEYAVKQYVDGQLGPDNLGNHTATQDLNMNGQWIGGDTDADEGIFVKSDGFVGIGTDNPSVALEVSGAVLASGTITSSDQRLKENIKPLQNSLEKIRAIDGYTYTWKDSDRGEGVQFGVLAQELEQVYPDVVHTFDDGYKAVNYQALIAPLIESVKELSDRVETLESENQKLQELLEQ